MLQKDCCIVKSSALHVSSSETFNAVMRERVHGCTLHLLLNMLNVHTTH